jgi:ankyrin repeat protein
MKNLILVLYFSIISFACSYNKHQLNMSDAVNNKDVPNEEGKFEHDYSDLEQFMDLLECATDDQIISSLLEKGHIDFIKLYPSLDGDEEGFIHRAAAKASLKVIDKLLELSGNNKQDVVTLKSKYNVTPLHIAALRGDRDIVEWFINKGADVNAKDEEGNPVLHYAAKTPANISVVRLLIANEAKIEEATTEAEGATLLHLAVYYDNPSLVRYLLNNYNQLKIDVKAKTSEETPRTAEEWATDMENFNIISAFDEFNETVQYEVHQ